MIFALTFVVMIWGVSSQDWWMDKMGALFLGAAIVVGVVARLGEKSWPAPSSTAPVICLAWLWSLA